MGTFTGMEPIIEVGLPEPRPWGTFLSVARELPDDALVVNGRSRLMAGARWQPWGDDLLVHTGTVDVCAPGVNFTGTTEGWESALTQPAFSFWKAYQCSTLSRGLDYDVVAARAVDFLRRLTSAVLTRELITGDASAGTGLSDVATQPVGSTAQTLAAAIAAADDFFDAKLSNGVGTVWVPSKVVTMLVAADMLVRDGDAWRLPAGHYVVGDAGFENRTPAGGVAASGADVWLYLSGPVDYKLTDIAPVGDGGPESLDFTTNIREAYAEGHGVIVFDRQTVGAVKLDL